MKKIQLIILLGAVLFLFSACTQQSQTDKTVVLEPSKEEDDTSPPLPEGENIIQITSSGFNPSTLTVTARTTVTFITMDGGTYWPASASHPSHTVYPSEGGCIGSTFDACKELAQGETFEFTFDEVGQWSYHDHLNPSLTGIVIVE